MAIQYGIMSWDWTLGGWTTTEYPLRSQTIEAKLKSGHSTHGLPYIIEICPYCGNALPQLSKSQSSRSVDCGNE